MEFQKNERELKLESFSELINCIFSNYPKEPNYFNLYNADIYLLTSIMLNGSKKIFGHTDPQLISEKQFALLQEYMQSVGYQIHYKLDENKIKIRFEKYIPKYTCHGFRYH
jgi:hypothetical protein